MDPETTPDTTPAPEAAPAAPAAGPWSSDLASYIADDNARAEADRYLREKWQPHVTQLEQQIAQAKPALALHQDFVDDPAGTLVAVGQQLYGEEFGQQLQGLLTADEGNEPEPEHEPTPAPAVDPRVQRMVEAFEANEQQQAYQSLLANAKTSNPDITIEDEIFHPFVIAADGDFDQAVAQYRAFQAKVAQHFGPAGEPVAAPPATLGSDATGVAVPPIQPKYDSLDAALDDTLAEMRANRAPVTV